MRFLAAITIISLYGLRVCAQSGAFSENGRWGAKLRGVVVVPPKFDTVIGFDQTGRVCLACFKKVKQTSSLQMRITSTVYRCNYLNAQNKRLVIKSSEMDTTSIFYLGKSTAAQFTTSANTMVVSIQDEKHLVDKNFTQLTFKGYHNIQETREPGLYACEKQSESETVYSGMIDKDEKIVVPFRYSNVKFSSEDSMLIACSAGFPHGTDDLYTFEGKKVGGSARHIHQANKKYMIQKAFDPDRFFLYNRITGAEQPLDADEVLALAGNEVVYRKKKSWFKLDAVTGEKKSIKQPTNE